VEGSGQSATEQPTLTDAVVTLRPWRNEDAAAAVAGSDELVARWTGVPPSLEAQLDTIRGWREGWRAGRTSVGFVIEHHGTPAGFCEIRRAGPADTTGQLRWALFAGHRGLGLATRAVRALGDWALAETEHGGLGLTRIEARVEPDNLTALRVATRSGLRREGVQRVAPGTGERVDTTEYAVFARLISDPPLTDPASFRALLNSFLPRKRAIAQMLVRDLDERVLLCQLTYKTDWDLPGGVVEVGESPHLAASRELTEELGLVIPAQTLLLTDWLPPWGGWDDALCLVFDGGRHPPSVADDIRRQQREIRAAEFCTPAQIAQRATDFTARRIATALAQVGGPGGAYAESGAPYDAAAGR
jgi:RimJ/RimL family protein N-acetyltransferase/8-oxo-dGTP pyrophosphatase MutT (NUDIX family)